MSWAVCSKNSKVHMERLSSFRDVTLPNWRRAVDEGPPAVSIIERWWAISSSRSRSNCDRWNRNWRRRKSSRITSRRFDDADDGGGHAFELRQFARHLLAAFGCEAVVAGAPVVLGLFPFGDQPAFDQHALQGGVERAFLHLKNFAGDLLDELGDSIPMHRSDSGNGAENQHVEGAGRYLGSGSHRRTIRQLDWGRSGWLAEKGGRQESGVRSQKSEVRSQNSGIRCGAAGYHGRSVTKGNGFHDEPTRRRVGCFYMVTTRDLTI